MNKVDKIRAIRYFLNEVLNKEFLLDIRKEEMLRIGSELCKGYPEWSDMFGTEMKPIDDTSKNELRELLKEVN